MDMKSCFLSMLLVLIILVGCREEERYAKQQQQSNRTIMAAIDNEHDTSSRTEVDAKGYVTWTETDKLGVFSDVSQNVPFVSMGSGDQVEFSGTLTEEDKKIKCVYFPYNEKTKLEGNKLTMTLPQKYNYSDGILCPMLGVEQPDGTFKFKQLCGAMRLTIKNAPKGTSKLTVIGTRLRGTAYVEDITAPNATLVRGNFRDNIEISFNLEEISDVTFCVPLVPATYSALSLNYIGSDGKKIFPSQRAKGPVTITRGMLLDMPALTALDDDDIVEGYLEQIDAYLNSLDIKDYTELKENVVSWLEGQSFITTVDVSVNECYDEINLVFKGGRSSFITLVKEKENTNVNSRLIFETAAFYSYGYKNKIFHIPAKDTSVITNIKSKVYTFLDLFLDDLQEDYYNKAISESPLSLDNDNLSDRTEAVKDLIDNKKTCGLILLTGTHGYEDQQGAFKIEYEGNIDYINSDDFKKYTSIPGYIYNYKKWKIIKCLAIGSDFILNEILDEQTLVYGSYCWSYIKNNRHTGNFIGHTREALVVNNAVEIWNFFYPLFSGMTVSESYDILKNNKVYAPTWYIVGSNELEYNNKIPNQRYFSITTDEMTKPNIVTGTINGYTNLKNDEIKYKIYYQEGTEPFSPDEVDNYKDITPENGVIKYSFTDLEPGKTYTYAIGFEYGDKYYYGDLKQFEFEEPVETSDDCTVELLNATCSGYVWAEKDVIEEYGICYSSTSQEPTTGVASTMELDENYQFSVAISKLKPETMYYYRAYAKFKGQDVPQYGEVKTFETGKVDLVNTNSATDVTHRSATASGYVFADEDILTDFGICYSESETPSLSVGEVITVTELDAQSKFGVSLSYLEPGTTYYYCAYAIIEGETEYGEIKSFKTKEAPLTPGKAIDLGLPSGTKWASHNVGASSPEGYGGLYGWGDPTGEHKEKTESKPNSAGYYGPIDSNYSYYGGIYDAPTDICGGELDIANAKWGGAWRLPSLDEVEEIIAYCTMQATEENGVLGFKFIGPNGNSIFLPYAGFRNNRIGTAERSFAGSRGRYWCGTRFQEAIDIQKSYRYADCLSLNGINEGSEYGYSSKSDRGIGCSIRPVK